MRKLLAVMALSISATAVAYASPSPSPTQTNNSGWTQSDLKALDGWLDQFGEKFEDWWWDTWGAVLGISDPDSGNGGGAVAAPEFDPASALAALTLLSGGLAVLRGRRTKK